MLLSACFNNSRHSRVASSSDALPQAICPLYCRCIPVMEALRAPALHESWCFCRINRRDRQQDQIGIAGCGYDAACVERHAARSEAGEVVLHLVAVDHLIVRQDVLDQFAQGGDVSLAIAQIVDFAAQRFRRREPVPARKVAACH